MSAFTDWNGPQGSGAGGSPRTADLTVLIEQYTKVVNALESHVNAKVTNSEDVHNVKDYVAGELRKLQTLIDRTLEQKIGESRADEKYATKAALSSALAGKAEAQDVVDLESRVNQSLRNYLLANDLDESQVIVDIKGDIETALQRLDDFDTWKENPPVLKATQYLEGMVHAIHQVTFTDKRIAAPVGGSDGTGVYYLLGILRGKAGVAIIKYQDTEPFGAVVNFTVTPEWSGALSVTCDSDLPGLKFKIVRSTDKNGNKHAYLAIQSTRWLSKFASTDGYGLFDKLPFDVSGINFIPAYTNKSTDEAGPDDYIRPASPCVDVCDCLSGKGLSFSKLGTSALNTQLEREPGNPYVTVEDLANILHVGAIMGWPFYDPDTLVAIDVPVGCHACDGTDVLPEDNVSDWFREHFDKYPLASCSIIQCNKDVNVERPSTPVYSDVSELPLNASAGDLAIVTSEGLSNVYKFNGTSWELQS